MSLVAHKYTPAEMSAHELEATFSGREHTVDYLLKSLRDQIHSATLSSFVITGPRGAGKSTIIHMVALRISQDPELSGAWLPVVFPEEQFNLVSLRDLLAGTLRLLADNQSPAAREWFDKVEAEPNEEQSQQLAVTGLRTIARQTGKRLILFIENLNQLLEEHLDDQMKGTLRRLLMTDPFMMVIGSTVHIFDSLKRYDEAFFNYFGQVPLDRLDAGQVTELLRKRATFDGNHRLLEELPRQQAQVKTLVYLTGGNPRFVLMLYELLSLRQVTTIVQYLRRLIDELTPLLKDEIENLPPQQRKIIHALMEKGGTAQPTDLTGATRLPLNAINTQLKRLKEAQIVEVLGGGKGRAAHYTVPDKLFSIWYQMRYLSQSRRRIELFVEVLRIWFEEEERVKTLKSLSGQNDNTPHTLRESATTLEYFAASLKGTVHERLATDLCLETWLKADISEAALAYEDLVLSESPAPYSDATNKQIKLADWLSLHNAPQKGIEILDKILINKHLDITFQINAVWLRAKCKAQTNAFEDSIADCTKLIEISQPHNSLIALGYYSRGIIKWSIKDYQGAVEDHSAALGLDEVSREIKMLLLEGRGTSYWELANYKSTIIDCDAIINLDGGSGEATLKAYLLRGSAKNKLGDTQGAIGDFTHVVQSKNLINETVAEAWLQRSLIKLETGDDKGALADVNEAIRIGINSIEFSRRTLLCHLMILDQEDIKSDDLMADCARIFEIGLPDIGLISMVTVTWFCGLSVKPDKSEISKMLARFSEILNSASAEAARVAALRFLNKAALASTRDAWPIAWRELAAKLKPDVLVAIAFLEPVCRVLEGNDRSLLDALPPEQREFALEVLAKFDAKPGAATPNSPAMAGVVYPGIRLPGTAKSGSAAAKAEDHAEVILTTKR